MAKIIKSAAFSGGVATYTPLDDDEAWLSAHANLFAWVSGSGLALRDVDAIWDDLVSPTLVYAATGVGAQAAVPSTAINGRPSIRCPGRGLKTIGADLPASYTILATAKFDAITGASQTVVGDGISTFARLSLGVNSLGYPSLVHNSAPSAVSQAVAITPGVSILLGGEFNDTTKAAKLYRDNVATVGATTFTDGHGAHTGFGIGQLGDNGLPMTGDIGDVLIFNAVLSDVDRQRAMRWLGRRAGITVIGV